MKTREITAERLREMLDYDPETGVFTRKIRTSYRIRVGEVAGKPTKNRYKRLRVDSIYHLAHRLAWLYMTGNLPENLIDHIDGNGHNNRWSNLRSATISENGFNAKLHLDNKAGVKGLCWSKEKQKWRAELRTNKVTTHLGYFDTVASGSEALRSAREKLHGEFAHHG